jgi:hypothetical protein
MGANWVYYWYKRQNTEIKNAHEGKMPITKEQQLKLRKEMLEQTKNYEDIVNDYDDKLKEKDELIGSYAVDIESFKSSKTNLKDENTALSIQVKNLKINPPILFNTNMLTCFTIKIRIKKGCKTKWANFLACLKSHLEFGINLRKGARPPHLKVSFLKRHILSTNYTDFTNL